MPVPLTVVALAIIVAPPPVPAAGVTPAVAQAARCAPVGGARASDAPRVVFASEQKALYNAGQQIGIELRGEQVSVGSRYFIRRPMTFKNAPRAEHTIGEVTILDIANRRATARIDVTCDAVAVGDHLEPFSVPDLPQGIDRNDDTGSLDRDTTLVVSYGVDGHGLGGGRDFMLAADGEHRHSLPGERYAVFHQRPASKGALDQPFAEAVVVAVYPGHSLLRITAARDAVATGDRLILRVGGAATATSVDDPAIAMPADERPRQIGEASGLARAVEQTYSFDDVHFDLNRQSLKDDAVVLLEKAVSVLKEHPELRVSVEGYTCDIGTTEYNLALGERRAQAVKDYLVNHGVDGERLSIVSYGEEHPKVENSDEDARKLNRRAVLVVNVHAGN